MLFNSPEYIFGLLPISVIGFFLILHFLGRAAAKTWLVLASFVFYVWTNAMYLPLILTSICVNFTIGRGLQTNLVAGHKKKLLLIAGLVFNLGLLGYYKYYNFFITNMNAVLGTHTDFIHVILPLGISFFTFQKIGYLVDSYKGIVHKHSFMDYALFVMFFPQLVSGPIVHHNDVMPQFDKFEGIRTRNLVGGIFLFLAGFIKKVFIADTFAIWANSGFNNPDGLALVSGWVTSLSYTFQLYFDFSGYSDMAVGAALMFNIKIQSNFNSPYKATSIQDFWRRWHITLSNFLRDYVYIPLGGARRGLSRTYFNLFVTFVLGGIWHGASWTFVAWGVLHGVAVVVHRFWTTLGLRMPRLLGWALTLLFVNFAWIFFRAESFTTALKVIKAMLGMDGLKSKVYLINFTQNINDMMIMYDIDPRAAEVGQSLLAKLWNNLIFVMGEIGGNMITPFFLLAGLLICLFAPNSNQMEGRAMSPRWMFGLGLLCAVAIVFQGEVSDFLYFHF